MRELSSSKITGSITAQLRYSEARLQIWDDNFIGIEQVRVDSLKCYSRQCLSTNLAVKVASGVPCCFRESRHRELAAKVSTGTDLRRGLNVHIQYSQAVRLHELSTDS